MKVIVLLVLFIVLPYNFCLLQKPISKQLLIAQPKHEKNYKIYSKFIFDELNYYRKSKLISFKNIEWSNELAASANKEADNLVKNRKSFGSHENFETWQAKNNDFTEIVVKLNSAGKIHSKKIFAMAVIQALHEKYRYNLAQKYAKGGVAMFFFKLSNHIKNNFLRKPYKIGDQYAVVIHLAN